MPDAPLWSRACLAKLMQAERASDWSVTLDSPTPLTSQDVNPHFVKISKSRRPRPAVQYQSGLMHTHMIDKMPGVTNPGRSVERVAQFYIGRCSDARTLGRCISRDL